MRNKILKNNQSDYISKGGVLYKPGEIPALTKEQLTQASLVSKLRTILLKRQKEINQFSIRVMQ